MTELEYLEERGRLLGLAYSINKQFFPRCVKARLRQVARFDAEICGADFDSAYNELLFEFNLKKMIAKEFVIHWLGKHQAGNVEKNEEWMHFVEVMTECCESYHEFKTKGRNGGQMPGAEKCGQS